MKFHIIISLLTVTLLAVSADAGSERRAPGARRREVNQGGRIANGVRSGELTREETQGLVEEQREIRQEKREYKSDGKLTAEERMDLHQDLNQASQNIYNEKHDAEQRGNGGVFPGGIWSSAVNRRQANQQIRIGQGVRSGELTGWETWSLERKEAHLAHLERRLKSDGTLTPAERARLQAELNELSRAIYRQKHDQQSR